MPSIHLAGARAAAAIALLIGSAAAHACTGAFCPVNTSHANLGQAPTLLAQAGPTQAVGVVGKLLSQEKRQAVYMTATDDDGNAYSFMGGVERPSYYKWLLVLAAGLAIAMIYFILLPVRAKAAVAPRSDPNAFPPIEPLPDVVLPQAIGQRGSADALWSQLVVACNGDPVRAATIISGEIAADPTVPAHSEEAILRALARVRYI